MRPMIAVAVVSTLSIVSFVNIAPRAQARKVDPRVLSESEIDHSISYSNILPNDYVGPQACAECHQEQYNDWKTHPHSCMNQLPDAESVKGDFSNRQLNLPTGKVVFQTELDEHGQPLYKMLVYRNVDNPSAGDDTDVDAANSLTPPYREYKVTKTVGSRYIQSYIGKQIRGPEPADHDIYREHKLPFGYWFKIDQWLPEIYFNTHGNEQLEKGVAVTKSIDIEPRVVPYTENCMNCHNTLSYAYRIFHQPYVGFPDAVVASSIESLAKELSNERMQVEGTIRDFNQLNQKLDPEKDLVTLGISCESCHLGGREHAKHERQIKFLPTSRYIKLKPKSTTRLIESRAHGPTLLGTCTQCHTGEVAVYPNGAGKGNTREARDLHGGHCASQISCNNCHDPHKGTPTPSGGPVNLAHTNQCIQCHEHFSSEESQLQHAGFKQHQDLNCLDCHMPRYTRGIDELIRTHRICDPVEESMVSQGSANACNACHLDKSTRWTLDHLEKGWGKKIAPQSNWPSYAKLDQPVGELWLQSEDSHLRLMAGQLYLRPENTGDPTSKRDQIIEQLNDPERINRVFASFAVKRLFGWPMKKKLPVNITASPTTRQTQIHDWSQKRNSRSEK